MSRIGKKPIEIPAGVTVSVKAREVEVRGPKGTLQLVLHPDVSATLQDNFLLIALMRETKQSRKVWGTMRALIANMVEGVTKGFEKRLEIEGVGYRASLVGKDLELLLGFSHPVKVPAPGGIEYKVEKNVVTVSGISKEDVGRAASTIRGLKPPEPYKGKGIHYTGEVIRRKAGKKATTAG